MSLSRRLLIQSFALFCLGIALCEHELFGEIHNKGTRNLAYTREHFGRHKCPRQIPAIMFRTEKDEQVRGNGTSIFFHQIEDCCEGYKRSKHDWNLCEPDCGVKCRNGFCRAPGVCECFDGFTFNDRDECVFACPLGCENGRCYLNGTCRCNRGYIPNPDKSFCRPICSVACGHNQVCVAPEKCDCKEGYQMTTIGCQPICTPDCGHGRCVAPNQCECFAGYAIRPPRIVCEADCYMTCENGFCDSRYRCLCYDGYTFDENTTSCLPDCSDRCADGVCISPGICKCFEGYQEKGDSCTPICENGCGYYGKCIGPNTCGCGYTNQECSFGNCDAVGRCLCSKGLVRFIDKCVSPNRVQGLVANFDQRRVYNEKLKLEFHNLIGRHFVDLYAF